MKARPQGLQDDADGVIPNWDEMRVHALVRTPSLARKRAAPFILLSDPFELIAEANAVVRFECFFMRSIFR